MTWVLDLLHPLCPFCQREKIWAARACLSCAQALLAKEHEQNLRLSLDGLKAFALFRYEEWARNLILRQKTLPEKRVISWMASQLMHQMPQEWRKTPLIWVPGRPLAGIHLVEALAGELQRLGHPLVPHPVLRRRLVGGRAQKTLRLKQRLAGDVTHKYLCLQTAPESKARKVLILDDIITSGATLLGLAKLLQAKGFDVIGALALAHTPRHSSSD